METLSTRNTDLRQAHLPNEETYRKFVFWPEQRAHEEQLEIEINADMRLTLHDCNFVPEATSDLITTSAGIYLINQPFYITLRIQCPEPARVQTRKILHSGNRIAYSSSSPIVVIAHPDMYVTCDVRHKSAPVSDKNGVIETLYHAARRPGEQPGRNWKGEEDFDTPEAFNNYLDQLEKEAMIDRWISHP